MYVWNRIVCGKLTQMVHFVAVSRPLPGSDSRLIYTKIEEKIRALQIAKNDDLLLKYNLEAITKFIKNKLGNLTQTYIDSTLEQKRILLCSIYPSGLHWGENGYSNTQISKFYRSILGIQTDSIPFGSA